VALRAKLDEGISSRPKGRSDICGTRSTWTDLLALGTALWVPTTVRVGWVRAHVAGSDLRARAEETLLDQAFGPTYRDYRGRHAALRAGHLLGRLERGSEACMLREHLSHRHTASPTASGPRGMDVSGIEGFSDAVFAFPSPCWSSRWTVRAPITS